jgi:hypothetical protein
MKTPEAIAESYQLLNLHDDTLVGLKALPTLSRGDTTGSVVEIRLRTGDQSEHVVRFLGCANLRVAMDFDVLAGNLMPNTSGAEAHCDVEKMEALMRSQQKDWDVEYGHGVRSPLTKKLDSIDELVFFRVQFFGGAVDVVARDFQVETTGPSLAGAHEA